jgi:CheY-like chemotaxis protein
MSKDDGCPEMRPRLVGNMNILIVEDNYEMRKLIRGIVNDLGSVVEATDGSEALAAYVTHRPDWVLMDLRMKTMDDIAATRQMKAAFPEARIMIVTDYDEADLREAATRAGVCGYLSKEHLLMLRSLLCTPLT